MKKHYFTLAAVRRILYFIMILSAYILQFIVIPGTDFPFPVMLLIPLGVAISMQEKEFAGMLCGLLTGILWDMASPHTDGLMTLIFTVTFLLTGLLTRYTLRNTLQTALLLTAVCSLIPWAASLMYTLREITKDDFTGILISELLPGLIISAALSIPVYLIVHGISKRFHKERS